MADEKKSKKKVVVTTSKTKKKLKPTTSKASKASAKGSALKVAKSELIFKPYNYYIMLAGLGLVLLGLLLMSGGGMPDPNTWDDSIIYSFRRTFLATTVILAGLGLEIYAIFKK